MRRVALLAVDVGTGSVRAALVDTAGAILAFAQREHEQHTPRPDWSEQSPATWWAGAIACIRQVREAVPDADVAAVAVCGQMHGTVPLDAEGEVLLDRVQLWNDKRAAGLCRSFAERADAASLAERAANPPAPAWIGFKLAWIKANQPDVYARTAVVLTPKDFIVQRLTGVAATDPSEASGSFLVDASTGFYDEELAASLNVDLDKMPRILASEAVVGAVTPEAAGLTGLTVDTPVVAGGGDFIVALLGSGVDRPGTGSDITGTSTLISGIAERPVHAAGVMNLCAATGGWVPFAILDAGGDAVRWARRAIAQPDATFETIEAEAAAVPPGCEGLLFLPYLNGERLGAHGNARAQFFGITARHGRGHFLRAVLEGVAFASARNLGTMAAAGASFERLVAAGGGAKSRLWLEIKASIYGVPLTVPEETESGILGCAALAGIGCGLWPDAVTATSALVRHGDPVSPQADLVDRYRRLGTVFDDLYASVGPLYDRLDAALA
ncbi:MAG: FGGY family carbohydrate kinase [Geminicoccaceae bacterium]